MVGWATKPLISSRSQAWKKVTSMTALSPNSFCSTPASQLIDVSGFRFGLPMKGKKPPVPKPNYSMKVGFLTPRPMLAWNRDPVLRNR